MSDAAQTFLHIGPNAGLGADEHQWILYRAGQPVSYVRSTKAVLVRCIREKGIELSAEGKAALDALADDFNAWQADPARRGTPVAAEACGPAKNIDADASGGIGGTSGSAPGRVASRRGLRRPCGPHRGEGWRPYNYDRGAGAQAGHRD